MPINIVPTKLALENPHSRDPFISFQEEGHIYTVHGDTSYTSVTTFNHQHFSHFDADAILTAMFRGKKMSDPTYKYYGLTKEQIKELWANNGKDASSRGTQMHYDIECFYNSQEVENDSIEYSYFKQFEEDIGKTMRPYRTEWTVYYEELKLSGSIDMVFENPDGTLQIYDWKRVKEISFEDSFGGKTAKTECIKHLPDTNFWHYSLQLNVYKTILEEKYGKKVTALYLVCLHPENPLKKYERIEVHDLQKEVQDLFSMRRQELSK